MKSNIIAISGTPVSGKSTTVDGLIDKLQKRGFDRDKIHVFNVGQEFRKYFNAVFSIMANFDDKDKVAEIFEEYPEMKKMSGSILQAIGNTRNKGIDANAITIAEANDMPELTEIRAEIDNFIDTRTKQLGKEIIERNDDSEFWIFDSRLAFNFIPESLAVRLTCRDDIAAKRLMADSTRGKEDSGYDTIEEGKEQLTKRKMSERRRYQDIYDIDLFDESNYDLIIDTSFAKTEDIVDTILMCQERFKNDQHFSQKWASPKQFLGRQNVRQTALGLEKYIENMRREGINPDYPVDAIEVDGVLIQFDGHHRTVSAAQIGKTLVPYQLNPEKYKGRTFTNEEDVLYGLNISRLYDHEDLLGFGTYDEVYPGLIAKIAEKQEEKRLSKQKIIEDEEER